LVKNLVYGKLATDMKEPKRSNEYIHLLYRFQWFVVLPVRLLCCLI